MNCETCKHNFVCKYKEEYIRVKEKSNSDEFKGIFDICCNEYMSNVSNAGRPPKFQKEQIVKVIELSGSGNSIREIAKEFDCSVGLIHKIINTNKR